MSFGDSQPETRTTQEFLSPEAQALQSQAASRALEFNKAPLTAPGAESVAGFDPAQISGQNQVLGATGTQGNIVGSAGGANQYLTSGAALDPNTNPGLKGVIDASTRPIWQGLTEQVLPGIRGSAAVSGAGTPSANYGGSRQGIAEGIASRGALTAAGDVAQKTAFGGYQSGLDAMLKAIGMAPGTAGSQLIPGLSTSAVGAERQGQEQRVLDAATAQNQFAQWLPFIKAQGLQGLSSAMGGGSTTSTGPAPQTNWGQTLGGAGMLAAGLLGSGGAGPAISSAMSLAPLLLSDMRLKRDIVQVGELYDGTPVYRFRFAGNDPVHIGLLAQDVEKRIPEAVHEIGQYKFVDYDLATKKAMEIKDELL